MNRQQRPITDRELKAWLAAGAVDRGVGEGLTFVASATAAAAGKTAAAEVAKDPPHRVRPDKTRGYKSL